MERQELKTQYNPLKLISKYRGALMGLAAISVLLLHINQNFNIPMPDALGYIYESGADMFLFLSGFGLFYSLEKNYEFKRFLKKRFVRVFPEFFISVFFFRIVFGHSFTDFLWDITTASFWIKEFSYYWYIALISVMYLVYPFVHKYIKRSNKVALALIIISILLNIVLYFTVNDFYCARRIAFQRIPVFFAGAVAAKYIESDHKKIPQSLSTVCCFIAMLSLFLSTVSDSYYRIILMPWTVCIAYLVPLLLEHLREESCVKKILNYMGKISLPVYLFYTILTQALIRFSSSWKVPAVVMIVLSVLITVGSSRLTEYLCDLIRIKNR